MNVWTTAAEPLTDLRYCLFDVTAMSGPGNEETNGSWEQVARDLSADASQFVQTSDSDNRAPTSRASSPSMRSP